MPAQIILSHHCRLLLILTSLVLHTKQQRQGETEQNHITEYALRCKQPAP